MGLKVIKQNKDGISRKALQEQTGLSEKQLLNLIDQMRKNQEIEIAEDG